MQIFITILHVFVCVVLILVVLLQAGKGASMGAAFGGSSQTIFGSSGPGTFLGKMTTVVAAVFMITSLALSYVALHKGSAVLDTTAKPGVEQTVPQTDQQAPPVEQSPAVPGKQEPAAARK